jgi:hypothetical protein
MIVPRTHRETVFDLTFDEWSETYLLLQRARALQDGLVNRRPPAASVLPRSNLAISAAGHDLLGSSLRRGRSMLTRPAHIRYHHGSAVSLRTASQSAQADDTMTPLMWRPCPGSRSGHQRESERLLQRCRRRAWLILARLCHRLGYHHVPAITAPGTNPVDYARRLVRNFANGGGRGATGLVDRLDAHSPSSPRTGLFSRRLMSDRSTGFSPWYLAKPVQQAARHVTSRKCCHERGL